VQADTLVPEPGNPQALNRYAYVNNNPLKYTDPSGHWLETAWDILNIAWDIYEVRRDPSLLNIGALVVDVGAAVLPFVPAGVGMVVRGGKAAKAAVEVASHADEAVDAAKIGAKVAEEVAEEAAERVGKEAAEETTQRLIRHHLATNKNWIREPQWSRKFQELFAKGGMSLEEATNIVELPAELHKGPHAQGYHQWVYQRLQDAIAGLDDPAKIRARLEAELRAIAEELKAHPEWLKNPPLTGGGR